MSNEPLPPPSLERVLAAIENRAYRIMEGTPNHHGIVHVATVRRFGRLIGSVEGGNIFNIEAAALLHDIRWWDEGDRVARKLTHVRPPHQPDLTSIGILDEFRNGVNQADYEDIAKAIAAQDKLPDSEQRASLTIRCSRDADRLSRSGIEGLLSILEANQNYQVPFYSEGGEIERSADAPVMPFGDIKTCIDDINACLDWEKIMETQSGLELARQLNQVNRAFLQTFTARQDIGYEPWIAWLRSIVYQQKERVIVDDLIRQGQFEEAKRQLIALEDPNLLSREQFERFIS